MDVLVEHLQRVLAAEGEPPGEQLVEDHACSVEIGRRRDRPASRLLWRHIGRRTDHRASFGQPGVARGAGDAEIGELCPSRTVDQHVLGLDVAVDDPRAVDRRQAAKQVERDPDGLVRRKRRLLADQALEVGAVDPLHDQVARVALLADVEDLDDVRVGDSRRGPRFPLEAGPVARVDEVFRSEELDRHATAEQIVLGQIGSGGAAIAQPLE